MVWIILRSALAAVFGVSAATKFLDREGTRAAAAGFGVPESLAPAVATLLPVAELAAAVALVPGRSARYGAAGALALLAAFIAGIAVNLLQGRKPDCHCFGQLYSEPVGPATLVRNLVIAAAAAAIAFASGSGAGGSVADDGGRATAGALAALVVVAGLLLLSRRSHGLVTGTHAAAPATVPSDGVMVQGLEIGTTAPSFALEDLGGSTVTLEGLLARGKSVLLVFMSPTCHACAPLGPSLADWQRQFPGRLTVTVLFSGNIDVVREKAAEYGLGEVLHDPGSGTARAYDNHGTPGAVMIGADGLIATRIATGGGAINELLLDAFGLRPVIDALGEDEAHASGGDHERSSHASADGEESLLDPEAIDGSFVPVIRDSVAITEHAGETVLLNRMTGNVHLLNPTAAIVWGCLDGTGTIDEIVADITDVLGLEGDEVRASVLEVVRRFGRQGLLAGVGVRTAEEPVEEPAAPPPL
jgi:thiol-disulfide isomerase/thioredoxin